LTVKVTVVRPMPRFDTDSNFTMPVSPTSGPAVYEKVAGAGWASVAGSIAVTPVSVAWAGAVDRNQFRCE
jgi:hypothetical protein